MRPTAANGANRRAHAGTETSSANAAAYAAALLQAIRLQAVLAIAGRKARIEKTSSPKVGRDLGAGNQFPRCVSMYAPSNVPATAPANTHSKRLRLAISRRTRSTRTAQNPSRNKVKNVGNAKSGQRRYQNR